MRVKFKGNRSQAVVQGAALSGLTAFGCVTGSFIAVELNGLETSRNWLARRLLPTSGQIREKGATGGGHHTKEAHRELDSVLVA